jgi:predicted amino acid racemase
METLSFCIRQVREETGYELPAVSLGGTAVYDALVAGTLCPEVTQVRMGEAFLFGFNTTAGRPIRGFRRDAFRLYGEIIEIREKRVPSEGTFGLNAFGKKADLGPTGIRRRAVVAFGQLVCAPEGLMPMDHGIRVAGATHDYTVLDLTDAHGDYAPGDSVGFFLSYGGAAQAMLSPCVDREFLERTESPDAAVRLVQER